MDENQKKKGLRRLARKIKKIQEEMKDMNVDHKKIADEVMKEFREELKKR